MPEARPVRVVYADEDAPYRTRLLRCLVASPAIDVVAVAVDGRAALDAIERHRPDVALVDLRTPGVGGLGIAEHIASHDPPLPTRVLLLAALPVESSRRVLQAVGLSGIVDRASPRDDICAALAAAGARNHRAVASGLAGG